jgi:outer membrane protein
MIAVVVFAPTLAGAADSPWKVRGRIIHVAPNDDSELIAGTELNGNTKAFDPALGTVVTVDSATTIEADVTYMFNASWGLEVIAAWPSHDLKGKGGVLDQVDLGTAKLLPPCFTAQYFFTTKNAFKPYVGLGLNYTLFSYDLSSALRDAGVSDVDLDNSLGFVANGGIDFELKNRWLLNFDVKYVDLSTEANVKLAGGGSVDEKVKIDIDPWIIGFGVGYRF